MTNRMAELLSRYQATVVALPPMTASAKFELLETLEQERKDSKSAGESQAIMDLHRIVEQDLWSWAMHRSFEERDASGGNRRKPLAAYMQQSIPLVDQLKTIAKVLPAIGPADRFTLLTILNERIHGRSKPAERLMFMDLLQMTRQSLWAWMTQKAFEERVSGAKKRKAVKKVAKSPARKPPAKKPTKRTAKRKRS